MGEIPTLHGNEEAIEECSARIYEILEVCSTGNLGTYDEKMAEPALGAVCEELVAQGYSPSEIGAGFADATRTLRTRDEMLTYIDPERYG